MLGVAHNSGAWASLSDEDQAYHHDRRSQQDQRGAHSDLGLIGMPGCFLYTPPTIPTGLANNLGSATWQLPVPNDTAHLGLQFFNQGFVLDPGANQLGAGATNGGAGVIGAR